MMLKRIAVVGILIFSFTLVFVSAHDYHDALVKSIIFFEGQRSGKLPNDQSITWRTDSGLADGKSENVDLTGGYYDAGDNIKFGLPMAFSVTMLSWSIIEFGKCMSNELGRAHEAVRWGTDYLLKASAPLPDALYVQVGDAKYDHQCWQRAEDIITPKAVYKVTQTNPGSDVAGETAAALAAASIVFKMVDPQYSSKLLEAAKKAFTFADKYRGNYSDHLSSVVCPFYCSFSGYQDELLWGAAWLFKATKDPSYLNYIKANNVDDDSDIFSWDNKLAGVRILLTKKDPAKDDDTFRSIREKAEKYICSVLPDSPTKSVTYTPGGLMFKMNGSNLQYVTASTFLLLTHARHLQKSSSSFKCGDLVVTSSLLKEQSKKQVDYILGDNPLGISFMVDYGKKFPQRIHHRGSSLPSMKQNSQAIGCNDGFASLNFVEPNPNILTGAIIGGPDKNDAFKDERNNYVQSEPTTYINAAFVGPLSYFAKYN